MDDMPAGLAIDRWPLRILSCAIIFGLIAGAAQSSPPANMLMADVHRSEWTPSLRVKVDLRSGTFDIWLPPDREWYSHLKKPVRREGRLSRADLKKVRIALQETTAAGLVNHACEQEWAEAERQGGQIWDNAVSPEFISANWRGSNIVSPARRWCASEAARRLLSLLDRLF